MKRAILLAHYDRDGIIDPYVIAAAKDFITPPAAALPLAEATRSADVTAKVLDAGHIGLVVGGFGPKVFYPLLSSWHAERTP